MPKREVLYKGEFYTVDLAITANDKCPAKKFLDGLSKIDREIILRIVKRLADKGRVANPKQFKKIEGTDFFEFKNFQIRMPPFGWANHYYAWFYQKGLFDQTRRNKPDEKDPR